MKNSNSNKIVWKRVWNNRKLEFSKHISILAKLMVLNGHFHSVNTIKINNWKKYGKKISLKLGVKKNESIFEFGCGGGALLYLFKSKTKKLSGCDFSSQLIDISKKIAPWIKIYHSDSETFKSKRNYDYVISNSMLEYVKSEKLEKILNKMICLFNKSLFIGEILDKKYEKRFLKRFNKPKNYYNFIDKKYLKLFCKKKGLCIKIYPSLLPGSIQRKYRYCALIQRNSKLT